MLSFCNFPQTYPTSTISVTVTVADLQLLPQDVVFIIIFIINSQGYSFSIVIRRQAKQASCPFKSAAGLPWIQNYPVRRQPTNQYSHRSVVVVVKMSGRHHRN